MYLKMNLILWKEQMKKTGKDFRMNKEVKRMLALLPFKDKEARSNFKRAMIDAQATAEYVIRENQRNKTNGSE